MKPSFTACATALALLTSTASAEWMRNADGEIWVPLNVAPSRDIDATTGPSDRAAPSPSVPAPTRGAQAEVGTTGSVAPPRDAPARPDFSELEQRDRRSCEMQTYTLVDGNRVRVHRC
jgi:hypothetical protein